MTIRLRLLAGCAALALVLAAASTGDARSSMHRTTFLTFSHAVGLPGVTLEPGTYSFELAMPTVDQRLVVVRTGNGQRLRYLGFTQLVRRPHLLRDSSGVQLGEAPIGTPPPVAVWYPPESADGRRFVYR
jgi:hypothetical protein